MSEIAPIAVLVAFILNALSCAVAVDNAQMQLTYLEAGHREDPGPAQVDLPEAPADRVVLIARPVRVPVDAGPSREVVMDRFKQLAAAPLRPHGAVVAFVAACVPAQPPSRPIGWASEALPLKQGNNEKPCQKHEKSVDTVSADQEVAPQNQSQFAGHRE